MVVVPGLNDEAVLEESLTDLWNMGDAVMSAAVVPVGLTQFSHLYTRRSEWIATRRARFSTRSSAVERARCASAARHGYSAPTSCTCSPQRELPGPAHYGEFAQIENGVGAVTSLRMRVAAGIDRVAASRWTAHWRRDRNGHGTADAPSSSSGSAKRPAPSSS